MAYQSWSVVFGEQPSAAKWNILGTNDASFNDGTGIADDAIKSRHIDWADTGAGDEGGIWWEEIGRTTLSGAGDSISVQGMSARRHLRVLIAILDTVGSLTSSIRFNNDSGNNYAYRLDVNDGTTSNATSQSSIAGFLTGADSAFITLDILNIATQNKGVIGHEVVFDSAASTAPPKVEITGKWANASDQITRIDVLNGGAGDFAIGSEVVVLGHN